MAKSPLATIRNLGGLSAALTRLGQAASDAIYRPPSEVIPGIDTSLFPNPGQPVRPIAPAGSEPLAFPFQYATNLTYTPRADAEYSAEDLKRLSEYPLSRWCIENDKDIVSGLKWQVQPRAQFGEAKEALEARAQGDTNIATITKFFERPDGEHDWPEWVRPLLEDMLVIDAPATLVRRDKKGKVAELRVTPGHVITRYIDANGYTPKPPAPAFCQTWSGIPRVNLDTTQLVYKPRNIAPRNTLQSYLYGYSPTEQAALEIEVGIKRLEWVGLSYTAGAVPGLLQVVPSGTDKSKIEEAMKWMNSRLAGNLAGRQQFQMAQGFAADGKDQFIQTREKILSDPFDDLHIHKICFAYGTSPQRLLKAINRAVAQSNQESAQEEGTKPWATWLFQSYMNHILQVQMGFDGYEFGFSMEVESDPVKIATANGLKLGKYISLNEARKGEGKDPRPEPEADQIGLMTPTGWMSITDHAPAGGAAAGAPGAPGSGAPETKPIEPGAKPPKGETKPAADETPKPKALLVLEGLQKAVDWQFAPRAATVEIRKAIAGLEDVKKNEPLDSPTDRLALLKAIEGLEWLAKYSDDQPRVPAGQPGGGEFGSGGGSSALVSAPENRKDWPAHIQELKLPPAWTGVRINPDPKAALQAIGKDAKGRDQYVYSKEFQDSQSAAKFARIQELDSKFDKIRAENDANLRSADGRTAEHAECASLVMSMGIRPGSEEDTRAKVQAYGATTLLGSHVVQEGEQTYLRFTGKKGVDINLPVSDQKIAGMLRDRAAAAGPDGQLFPHVSGTSLLEYTHQFDGGGFKTKDFRTLLGTREAAIKLGSMRAPSTQKEYVKAVRAVAEHVSARLGNTPTVALTSYIHPAVFAPWRARLAA